MKKVAEESFRVLKKGKMCAVMIGALPMILSYNGKKGYNIKYFFYIFYILHILILWFISKKIIF